MEYGYEMELDPVQWQSTQKQVLGDVFRDAPAPPPPLLPTELPVRRNGARSASHGVKRKRQSAPDNDSQRSQDNTSELIELLGRGLSARVNPARRNTRVASAGAVMLGPSVGASTSKSTVMPPPKLKTPKPVAGPSELDKVTTPLSDAESFNWGETESLSSAAAAPRADPISTSTSSSRSSSSSNLTTTALPCTPPNRAALSNSRPMSMPTLTASSLISPEQNTVPPSPPTAPRPTLSIHTKISSSSVRVDTSAFSVRSDSASTTASTDSNATATTVAEDQVSPITPGVHRESLPIIDLTLTPTPSPPAPKPPQTRPTCKAPPVAAVSSSSHQPPPQAAVSRPAPARSAPSEPQPPRAPVQLPARAKTIPSQTSTTTTTTSRPSSQQWPRVFPSSQTRLGLGAMGKGYDAASRPFRVPNKGKAIPLTVTALPLRGRVGTSAAGKAKAKSPAKPSAAGRLNFAPAPAAPPSPTKRKENTAGSAGKARKEPVGRKTPTPVGRATTTRGATTTVSRTAASSKARKEPSSDTESYLASDTSFDDDALEAALAEYDD